MSNIVIPDGGNIGSASDPDAISIASNGKPTFSQGIANSGTIDAGTLGSSVVFPAGTVINHKSKVIHLDNGTSNYMQSDSPAGAIINVNSTDLQVTGFSATSGNTLVMWFNGLSYNGDNAGNNGLVGFSIAGDSYATQLFSGSGIGPVTPYLALTLGSDLTSATIGAWIAGPNSAAKKLYIHDYSTNDYTYCSLTVMEIKE